jgi:hypothetical protein
MTSHGDNLYWHREPGCDSTGLLRSGQGGSGHGDLNAARRKYTQFSGGYHESSPDTPIDSASYTPRDDIKVPIRYHPWNRKSWSQPEETGMIAEPESTEAQKHDTHKTSPTDFSPGTLKSGEYGAKIGASSNELDHWVTHGLFGDRLQVTTVPIPGSRRRHYYFTPQQIEVNRPILERHGKLLEPKIRDKRHT